MSQEQSGSYHELAAMPSLADGKEGASDMSVLTSMAHMVAAITAEMACRSEVSYPFFMYREEGHYAYHRIVIYAQPQPDACDDVPFVGFVSQHRPQIDPGLAQQLGDVDRTLVMELAAYGNLLSYSSLQLAEGNWVNLVRFARPDGKETILSTKTHQHAAYELAPRFYQWIRLHHGLIPQGDPANGLQLHLTKYYTFHASNPRPDMRVHHYQQVLAV